VKNKILSLCLVLFTLITISCKKEKEPAVIGKWTSISNYTEENSHFTWKATNGFSQTITFNPDARFNTFVDMATGGGTYAYDKTAAKIDLHYEADYVGTTPVTVTYKIDLLTNTRLIVSSFSSSGNLQFKTEYIRLD
jgi:hypothetical protein